MQPLTMATWTWTHRSWEKNEDEMAAVQDPGCWGKDKQAQQRTVRAEGLGDPFRVTPGARGLASCKVADPFCPEQLLVMAVYHNSHNPD